VLVLVLVSVSVCVVVSHGRGCRVVVYGQDAGIDYESIRVDVSNTATRWIQSRRRCRRGEAPRKDAIVSWKSFVVILPLASFSHRPIASLLNSQQSSSATQLRSCTARCDQHSTAEFNPARQLELLWNPPSSKPPSSGWCSIVSHQLRPTRIKSPERPQAAGIMSSAPLQSSRPGSGSATPSGPTSVDIYRPLAKAVSVSRRRAVCGVQCAVSRRNLKGLRPALALALTSHRLRLRSHWSTMGPSASIAPICHSP
jgi:hypothetical protein